MKGMRNRVPAITRTELPDDRSATIWRTGFICRSSEASLAQRIARGCAGSRESAHPDPHPDNHHQELGEKLHVEGHLAPAHIEEEHGADLIGRVAHLMGKGIVPEEKFAIGQAVVL